MATQPDPIVVQFKREKETKNKQRYEETSCSLPGADVAVIDKLYLHKIADEVLKSPKRIKVTIEVE